MNIWIPTDALPSGGASVYVDRLKKVLVELGHQVEITPLTQRHFIYPRLIKRGLSSVTPDVIIADIRIGFALKGMAKYLVVIQHHCVFDPEYLPFKSFSQKVVHNLLWYRYERDTLQAADVVVAVSNYTKESTEGVFGKLPFVVIPNAIETEFFVPEKKPHLHDVESTFSLLYVGNLFRRKGADLLPGIMSDLGAGFELRYTAGLREDKLFKSTDNMVAVGRLSTEQLRDEYQKADVFLFPTRFEGFGYAAAEAMSCGTPVVSTRSSSIPEVVQDGVTGILCDLDDVTGFAEAVRELRASPDKLAEMSKQARIRSVGLYSMRDWAARWNDLLEQLGRSG